MKKEKNFFDCGLKGTALSYLNIHRLEGLSEKGKDKFISILLDATTGMRQKIQKEESDDAELIRALRDELYEKLPTGDIDAFELLKVVKRHINQIDEAFPDLCPSGDLIAVKQKPQDTLKH